MEFPSFERGKAIGEMGLGRKLRSSILYVLVFRYLFAFSADMSSHRIQLGCLGETSGQVI